MSRCKSSADKYDVHAPFETQKLSLFTKDLVDLSLWKNMYLPSRVSSIFSVHSIMRVE